jgi:hypothetical protein
MPSWHGGGCILCRLVCVQSAALAEFRADWPTATRMYTTAYGEVQKVAIGSAVPLQRFFEITACAERFHVKVGCKGTG